MFDNRYHDGYHVIVGMHLQTHVKQVIVVQGVTHLQDWRRSGYTWLYFWSQCYQ